MYEKADILDIKLKKSFLYVSVRIKALRSKNNRINKQRLSKKCLAPSKRNFYNLAEGNLGNKEI